jgi:uncharacterized membrane protein
VTDIVSTITGPRSLPSDRSRLGLAAFMTVAGITHFAAPKFYQAIVPAWAGDPKRVVAWSGVAELLCGALVAIPRTKRLGAWFTLVVLVAVYPANINMALQAGAPHDGASWAAWLRLPLQVPMWRWAFRHTRTSWSST